MGKPAMFPATLRFRPSRLALEAAGPVAGWIVWFAVRSVTMLSSLMTFGWLLVRQIG